MTTDMVVALADAIDGLKLFLDYNSVPPFSIFLEL